MNQLTEFIVDRIARTSRAIALRVTALNHETGNDSVKHESIIKTTIRKFNKVCNCIRRRLKIQIENYFAFMRRNNSFDRFYALIVPIKNLPFGKAD